MSRSPWPRLSAVGAAPPAALTLLILLGGLAAPAAPTVPTAPAAPATPAAPAAPQPPAAPATAAGPAPAAARGKQIYTAGTSPAGGEITAVLGEEGGTEVPATALPCAGCHGADGRGSREGGVRPSDLTWEALSRPAPGQAGGRQRPPYTDRLLIRAVTLGFDAAGNRLHVAMPRYRLTRQDAADLLAYLKRLGHEADPGVSAGAIHLGVLLPGDERRAVEAAAVEAALAARFAELNHAGGIYGRQLTASFARLPEPPAERVAKLRERLASEPLFALLGAHLAGAEAEMAAAAAGAAVPLIGPLASRPMPDVPLNRYVFYVTPGLAEQAATLVEVAARQLPQDGRRLVIVRPVAGDLAAIADAAGAAARRHGFTAVETVAAAIPVEQAAALAGRLAHGGAAALLLLDSGPAVQELLRHGEALGWRPLVLLPGSLPGGDPFTVVPASLADRLLLSLPLLPVDRTPGEAGDYRRLAAAHGLSSHHVAAQRTALAAAAVLIEGLERCGRDASRETLIAALEKLYRFDAGLGAPLTFGPNRRVGALGAYVTGLDLAHHTLGPQTPWIELEP